jgi:hypothetical protein
VNDLIDVLDANALGEFVAHIVARYGDRFRYAWYRWNSPADEWDNLRRDVTLDVLSQKHYIRLRIDKASGEVVFLHGSASSMMSLAAGIVRAFADVGVAEAFTETSRNEFIAEVTSVLGFLAPAEPGDEAAEAGGASAESASLSIDPDRGAAPE